MKSDAKGQPTTREEKNRPCISLARFLSTCILIGTVMGLVAIQQQRQRNFMHVIEFVENSFDTGACVPAEVSTQLSAQYPIINANRWISSVGYSPDNGPGFISGQHELIYQPSANGIQIADITIETSWHCLQSQPKINIVFGGGEHDDIPLEWLRENIIKRFQVIPSEQRGTR